MSIVSDGQVSGGLQKPLINDIPSYSTNAILAAGRGGRTGKSITFFTGENHERGLAGELAKVGLEHNKTWLPTNVLLQVLRESGFECEGLKKFPMTIKKKEHSAYGAFFKETSGASVGKKIKF